RLPFLLDFACVQCWLRRALWRFGKIHESSSTNPKFLACSIQRRRCLRSKSCFPRPPQIDVSWLVLALVLSQQASIFGSHGNDPGDAVSGQTVFDCYFMKRVSLRTKSISILDETKAECDEIQRDRCRHQAGSHDEQPYRASDINQQNGGRGQGEDQPSQGLRASDRDRVAFICSCNAVTSRKRSGIVKIFALGTALGRRHLRWRQCFPKSLGCEAFARAIRPECCLAAFAPRDAGRQETECRCPPAPGSHQSAAR